MRGLMMVIFEEAEIPFKRSKIKPKQSSENRKNKTVEELELKLQYSKSNDDVKNLLDSGKGNREGICGQCAGVRPVEGARPQLCLSDSLTSHSLPSGQG